MSVKRMRVYICDVCGKKAPEETRTRFFGFDFYTFKSAPDGWERKVKMDFCDICASNFARMMKGEKESDQT